MDVLEMFGTNVRQYRKVNGMTQASFAEAADLSVEMIGKIERGASAPSFESIVTISEVLKVSPAALFGAEEDASHLSDRGKTLQKIQQHLTEMNDTDLEKAEGMLAAFLG